MLNFRKGRERNGMIVVINKAGKQRVWWCGNVHMWMEIVALWLRLMVDRRRLLAIRTYSYGCAANTASSLLGLGPRFLSTRDL